MRYFPFPDTKNLTVGFSTKEKDFQTLLSELKLTEEDIVAMYQIHGNNVAWVGKKELGTKLAETDGLVTAEKGVFLSVRVADCVPVLYFDPESKTVAVAHCGWRGVKNGLSIKVVEELKAKGVDPQTLLVSFGPSARDCCYNVQEDLAKEFVAEFGQEVVQERNGEFFLSLQKCLSTQLLKAGLKENSIFDSGICTIHNASEFHSWRADKQKGNNVAIIGLPS